MRIPSNLLPDTRVYYLHLRYEDPNDPLKVETHGGATVAFRRYSTEEGWEVAVAVCNLSDNFCRKIGRTIAHNRLNWGTCHRLPITLDESKVSDVEDLVRKFVLKKYNLIPQSPTALDQASPDPSGAMVEEVEQNSPPSIH